LIAGLGSYAFRWSIGHKDRIPSKPMTPIELLNTAVAMGFSVVQYADNMPLHKISKTSLDILATAAKTHGIAIEVGVQSFDSSLVHEYLEIAKRLNAKILRVALDAQDAVTPLDKLGSELTTILPIARDDKCQIAIENHFDFPSRRMAKLLDQVNDPTLGACLDVANSICAGEWPEETIEILAPYTINLHLKDYVIIPDPYGVGFAIHGCPLGQGLTNLSGVLAKLDHRPMSVIYEHWLPWPGNFKKAKDLEISWTSSGSKSLKNLLV
jgi:sugar phosphate isomerase/epimerase